MQRGIARESRNDDFFLLLYTNYYYFSKVNEIYSVVSVVFKLINCVWTDKGVT